MSLMLLAVSLALAADPPTDVTPSKAPDVVPEQSEHLFTDAPPFEAYRFQIKTCDGVRAQVLRDTAQPKALADEIFVEIDNQSGGVCLYRGVILQGGLEGTYKTNKHRRGDAEGFFVAPGEQIRLLITPKDPNAARDRVRLEIAPERATILLRADAAPKQEAPVRSPAP